MKPIIEAVTEEFLGVVTEMLPYVGLVIGVVLGIYVLAGLLGVKMGSGEEDVFTKALIAGHNAEMEEDEEDEDD